MQVAQPEEEYAWVQDWSYTFDGDPGQLHALGEIEMQELGMRFSQKFPDLLGEPYTPTKYMFVSSQVHSCSHFSHQRNLIIPFICEMSSTPKPTLRRGCHSFKRKRCSPSCEDCKLPSCYSKRLTSHISQLPRAHYSQTVLTSNYRN